MQLLKRYFFEVVTSLFSLTSLPLVIPLPLLAGDILFEQPLKEVEIPRYRLQSIFFVHFLLQNGILPTIRISGFSVISFGLKKHFQIFILNMQFYLWLSINRVYIPYFLRNSLNYFICMVWELSSANFFSRFCVQGERKKDIFAFFRKYIFHTCSQNWTICIQGSIVRSPLTPLTANLKRGWNLKKNFGIGKPKGRDPFFQNKINNFEKNLAN